LTTQWPHQSVLNSAFAGPDHDFELSLPGKLTWAITTLAHRILAYFHTGRISNGITEAVSML
jgi:hypothetical protein